MQIQQSIQNITGTIQAVPPQVLAGLLVGQQIEAAVVKASLAAQTVSLKVGNTLLQVTTPVPLKQGQIVQLELVQAGGKPVLRLVTPSEALQNTTPIASALTRLVPGQRLPIEVIKLLAENRLLVQTTPTPLLASREQTKPVQFDIDITRLTKSFTIGEKAIIEVISTKPLAIALKTNPAVRDQVIVDKIKQLLPQLDAKPQLNTLATSLKTLALPQSVRGQIQQLFGHILDKHAVNQPQALQKAIASSGVFTEQQLLKPHAVLKGDFKANLLRVATVIEAELTGKPALDNAKPITNVTKAALMSTALASLSTGSLGKSQGPVTRPELTPVIAPSGPRSASSQVTDNEGRPVKSKALSSPFAFQNTAKIANTSNDVKDVADHPKPNTARRAEQATPINSVPDHRPRMPFLASVSQAIGAYNPTKTSVSILNSQPSLASLPNALPPFLEAVLTSQQATALAQALNKSITVEQVMRASGQFDVLILQGLLKEVESLHARVQLNQFSMLKEPDMPVIPMMSWLLDLPIKDKQGIDLIQLQIDQFKSQSDDKENDIWSVQLRLDTQNLGPLQATVTMHIDDIKIVLRAERAGSAALLEAHIGHLQHALSKLGVSVSHVSCSFGEVAESTLTEQYLAETTNLVDVSV